jgi:hypothetical protein
VLVCLEKSVGRDWPVNFLILGLVIFPMLFLV